MTSYQQFLSLYCKFERSIIAVLLASALILLASLSMPRQFAASAQTIQAAGSHVVFDLPPDFVSRPRQGGFFSQRNGATIRVLDLPLAAYDSFAHGFARELEKKGYADVLPGHLPGRGDDHLYFFAHQRTPVGRFDKHMLIIRDKKRAAYITLTVNPPELTATPLAPGQARAILSKVWLSTKKRAITRDYGLDYLGGFKESEAVAGSTLIMKPARLADEERSDKVHPLFIIAPSLSRQPISDMQATGRKLMKKFARFENIALEAEEKLTVDNLDAYGLSAFAADKRTRAKAAIYQMVIARPGGGYYRLVGVCARKRFARYLERFRRMAASFHLSPPRREEF